MSDDRWNTVLVLGGIRSGKSAFAESLVADAASIRYVATAVGAEDDQEWAERIEAHQRRRPQSWSTEETGADPTRLAELLAQAKPDETLLVDDLGGWIAALLDPANQPNDDVATVAALAEAVRHCAARLVVVSPEVGLSLVPVTPVGRAFTDALGTANQALAAVCDRVALVVAGQATWLKLPARAPEPVAGPPAPVAAPRPATPAPPVVQVPADDQRAAPASMEIEPGMDLPLPDSDAGPDAGERLATLDLPGAGLGALRGAVEFAAATQGTTVPRAWDAVRVILVSGHHRGGAAAGVDADDVARRVAQVQAGEGALIRLAGAAGADIAVVRAADSDPMEDGPAGDAGEVVTALRQGFALAGAAAADGKDALVIASCGGGTDAAATALLAAATGAEPVAVLPRVQAPGGFFDDAAWMTRCTAVRDALHRIRHFSRGPQELLVQLGGADLAVATGAVLGAAAHRLPVLLDGPVGVAAALVARDYSSQSRHWCLIADAGTLRLVEQGADVLGLTPVLKLGLDLGEGANALAALPLLRAGVGLAGDLPVHPALLAGHDDQDGVDADPDADAAEFVEPEPAGPGPATTAGPGE